MKNIRTSLAFVTMFSAGLAPSVSHAQSSVTLYGAFDTALGFVTNTGGKDGSSRLGFVNGTIQTNSWGLRGTEALGNGLSLIFNLQGASNPSTGALPEAGVEFRRRAYIGLSSDTYGTISLGRQADPVSDALTALTADQYFGSIFTTVGNVDNYDALLHINNSIKYTSPMDAGLQFEAMIALNDMPGSIAAGGFYSFGISYTQGGISIGGGYVVNKVENSMVLSSGLISTTTSTVADGLAYNNQVVQFKYHVK